MTKLDRVKAVSTLHAEGAQALAALCIQHDMAKAETLQEYRQSVIVYEKGQGREVSSFYVLGDAYDKENAKPKTLYKQYKAQRAQTMAHYTPKASDAVRAIKHAQKLAAWLESIDATTFHTDGENVAHEYIDEKGYKYVFKAEYDDFPYYEDMKWQGYSYEVEPAKPGFAYHCGQGFTHHKGEGLQAWLDLSNDRQYVPALFDIPESYMQQFYNNKDYGKGEAYSRMVQATKTAIKQDIDQYCKNDMLVISVTVYDKHGEEVYRDSLGGCDYEYVTSGDAFFENAMFESCKEEAQKDFATVTPQAIPQNYTHGAFI